MSFAGRGTQKPSIFLGPVEGQNPIFRLDLNSKAITQVLADKTIDASDFDAGERRLFYIKRSVGEPAEIYSAEIVNGKAVNAIEALAFQRGTDERSRHPSGGIDVGDGLGRRTRASLYRQASQLRSSQRSIR